MQIKISGGRQQSLIDSPRALSPVNLITNKTHIYKQAILERNKFMKKVLMNLSEQLQRQRQKNKGMLIQIKKQEQKEEFWKQKYTEIVNEYQNKKSFFVPKREELCSQARRMTQDNEEEYDNSTTEASQAHGLSIGLNVKRSSLLGKSSRKRQALSLTHLHRHHYQGNRKFFCEK